MSRDERLKDLRKRALLTRSTATVEQRDERLEYLREHAQQTRANETDEQRQLLHA